MLDPHAAPAAFGAKLKSAAYYAAVNSIIGVMRPLATLRTLSCHLNTAQFLTPSGLIWNRSRLANYLRNTAV